MKREELRQEFERACEIKWENSQGEPDIDYVMWLEDKILSRHLSGGIVDITAEEFIREKMRQKYGIENKEMAGLWTYKCNGEEALRWAHEFANIKNAPLPPAEGAEEILIYHNLTQPFRQILQSVALHGYDIVFAERDCVKCATDFATLHAQKIADKMVEERLREELIKFDAWGYGSFTENKAIIDDVDEYLKSRER